jgi:hypothetical protein
VLAGLSLFYVGAVLCLIGFWLLGRIRDKEIAVSDISLAESCCWWPLISHSVRVLTWRAALKVSTGVRFRSACRGFFSEC